jgi:hypothetical protein
MVITNIPSMKLGSNKGELGILGYDFPYEFVELLKEDWFTVLFRS